MWVILVPVLAKLAGHVIIGMEKNPARTDRGGVEQAREGHDPVVHGINDVATIQLEKRAV